MHSSPAILCSEPHPAADVPQAAARAPVRAIPSLDGIRAVSFMMVFASHSGFNRILVVGDVGVTVFFFLSGFLITTLLRAEFERSHTVNIKHFYLRRALRILPVYYLVLLAAMLLGLVLYPPGTVTGLSVAAKFLFFENFLFDYRGIHGTPGTSVVWSLAVEEHFYLLFPWLFVAMQKWRMPYRSQAWFLWGLCLLVLAWRCLLVLVFHVNYGHIFCATDCRVDAILFGCALALWNNPVLDPPRGSPGLWKYGLLPAALAVFLMSVLCRRMLFQATVYFSIQGAALTLVFIGAIRFNDSPLFRFLNWRWVAFIGTLSYSLYLIHEVLLYAVIQLWPRGHGSLRVLLALAVSLILAWTIYVLIERPCAVLRWKLRT